MFPSKSRFLSLAAALGAAGLLSVSSLHAASITWANNGTAPDTVWTTVENWVGGVVPNNTVAATNNPDTAIFPAGTVINPSFGEGGSTVGGIIFNSDASSYTIGGATPGDWVLTVGNTTGVAGVGILNNSTVTQTFSTKFAMGGTTNMQTVAGGTLIFNNGIDVCSATGANRTLTLSGAGNTIINGTLTQIGPGGVGVQGTGNMSVQGNGHNLTITAASNLTGNFNVTVPNVTVNFNNAGAFGNVLNFYATSGAGAHTFTGNVTLGNTVITSSVALRVDNTSGSPLTYTGNSPLNFAANATFVNTNDMTFGVSQRLIMNGNRLFQVSGGNLTFDGEVDINYSAASNRVIEFIGPGNVIMNGLVRNSFAGSGGRIANSGTGTITLSVSNTYNQSTVVNSGAIEVKADGALSTATGTTGQSGDGSIVRSGGVLRLSPTSGDLTIGNESLALAGAGLTAAPNGALHNVSGNNTWAGAVVLGQSGLGGTGNASIQADAGSSLTMNGGISMPAVVLSGTGTELDPYVYAPPSILTLQGAGDITVATVGISGATDSSLVKNGGGTATLSAANTYDGGTTVNAGTLLVDGSLGAGTVTVAGGTLGGTGTISAGLTLTGGALAPGNSAGTLTVEGVVTASAASTLNFEIGASIGSHDILRAGSLNATNLTLNLTNPSSVALTSAASFILFKDTADDPLAVGGTFTAVNLPAPGSGYAWDQSALYTSGTLSLVASGGPSFASWQASKFTAPELADPNISGPNAIFGADGLTNLVKYGLGLEPKQNIVAGLPVLTKDATNWIYTYTRPSNITDVNYAVEATTSLATAWSTASVSHTMVSDIAGVQTWQALYPRASAPTKINMRVRVTLP